MGGLLSEFKKDWGWNSTLLRIGFFSGFLIHCAVFLISVYRDSYLIDDSIQYLLMSDSMQWGTLSQAFRGEHFPDLQRLPAYPFFLLLCFQKVEWVLAIQHLLVFVSAWLLIRISKAIGNKENAVYVGIFFWIQPYTLWFSSLILTEVLFIFACILAVAFILLHPNNLPFRLLGFAILGLSILIRPVGFVLLIVFGLREWILNARKWKGPINALLAFGIAACCFVPWMLRNQFISGTFSLSSMTEMTQVHGRLAGIELSRRNVPFNDDNLLLAGDSMLAVKYGIGNLRTYRSDGQNHELNQVKSFSQKELFQFAFTHPSATFQFFGKASLAYFSGMGMGWAFLITGSEFLAWFFAGIQFLISICLAFGIGSWFFQKGQPKILTYFFFVWLLFFFISLLAWTDGRYRVPADSFIFLFIPFTISTIKQKWNLVRTKGLLIL